MKGILLALLLVLINFSASDPVSHVDWDGLDGHVRRDGCLTDASARMYATIWENFYVNFNMTVANKYLAPDLEVISDSINFATPGSNMTPGAVTVASKSAFIKASSSYQNDPTFTTLNVWYSCNSVTLRWRWNVKPIASIGIDVLDLVPGSHLIQRDYSENYMLAYLYDNNCNVTCHKHKCELTYGNYD